MFNIIKRHLGILRLYRVFNILLTILINTRNYYKKSNKIKSFKIKKYNYKKNCFIF